MTDQPLNSTLHALLIGIDHYLPNRLPDGGYFRNLSGCVRDVSHVEKFLLRKTNLDSRNILKLTSSNSDGDEPPEPRELWPTYENIVRAFQNLGEKARPDDQIYIHYSGHGNRCAALIPEIKTNGLDEVLVPMDLGSSEPLYLRDIEMAKLLKSLVDLHLMVTIVLDSCHSAGATRDLSPQLASRTLTPGPNASSTDPIDLRRPRRGSLVASIDDLKTNWEEISTASKRSLSGHSGWVPGTADYVLLAACRSTESAFEFAFDGKETNGALTYWLLNTLEEMDFGLTYNQLNDRLVARVHSQFERQTPQLEGDGNRTVFGSNHVKPVYSGLVMQVDMSRSRVLLNAGQAHGLRKGAEFAIYPSLTTDFSDQKKRLAIATIKDLGAVDSWADLLPLGNDEVAVGAAAVLIGPGSGKLVRRVRVIDRQIPEIEAAINDSAWLELAEEQEAGDYQIKVAENYYQILDRTGIAIRHLEPPIKIEDQGAASQVAQRLEHLTRYHAVQELDNYDSTSPLAGKLVIEWAGSQKDFEHGQKPEPHPFELKGDIPGVAVGEYVFLRIKNSYSSALNVAVLDLQPDWGISQIHPLPPTWFQLIDAGQEVLIPFGPDLPRNYQSGTDVVKVFATVDTANFRWLQLPPLDQQTRSVLNFKGGDRLGPLDRLLAAVSADLPPTRNLMPAAHPSAHWTTAQLEIQVVRPDN